MTEDSSPTLRRHELGAWLRRLRHDRSWSADYVAEQIGCSVSKISRMETGARGVSPRDVKALIDLFQLDQRSAEHLERIARTAKRRLENRSAIVVETDFIRMEDPAFVDLERDSVGIREYNSLVVPGLLQTEDYMRSAISGSLPDLDRRSTEDVVAVRLERQEILRRRNPPVFDVVLDEAALRREVGGPAVMREQIRILLDASDRGTASISVIPFRAGAHPGVNSDFVALRTDEPAMPNVVFVEGLAGHLRFDKAADVARYQRVWLELASMAVPLDLSENYLSAIVEDLSAR